MASEFFETSTTWVVDARDEERPRRWFRVFAADVDARSLMAAEPQQLYGKRAQGVDVRPATDDEEAPYLRGNGPRNKFWPAG